MLALHFCETTQNKFEDLIKIGLNFPKISIEQLSRGYSVKCYLTYLAINFSLGVLFLWFLIDTKNISKWNKNLKCPNKPSGYERGSEGVYQVKH